MRRIAGWLTVCGLLLLSGCATQPGARDGGLSFGEDERRFGESHFGPAIQVEGGAYTADPELVAYVAGVGERLAALSSAPGLAWEFRIIGSPLPDAWGLSGGKVAVTRGLLTELSNEAELAAILSHQIAHVTLGHMRKRVRRTLAQPVPASKHTQHLLGEGRAGYTIIRQRFTRGEELEADKAAMALLVRAGYDPTAAVALQEMFVYLSEQDRRDWREGLLAAHPASQARVTASRKELRRHLGDAERIGTLEPAAYSSHIIHLLAASEGYDRLSEGHAALAGGETDIAREKAAQAVSLIPEEAAAHALAGHVHLYKGEYREAEAAFSEAIRIDDGQFSYFLARGAARRALGQTDGARDDFMHSVELVPTTTAHLALGEMDEEAGNTDAAMEHFRAAGKGQGESARKAAVHLARRHLALAPGQFVLLSGTVDPSGFLVVRITNRSKVALKDIRVLVLVAESEALRASQNRLTFEGMLPSGKSLVRTTSIGPLTQELVDTLVEFKVEAAAIGEPP